MRLLMVSERTLDALREVGLVFRPNPHPMHEKTYEMGRMMVVESQAVPEDTILCVDWSAIRAYNERHGLGG